MKAIRIRLSVTLLLTLVLGGLGAAQVNRAGSVTAPGLPQPDIPVPATVSIQPPPVTDLDTVLLTVSVTGAGNKAVNGVSRGRFQVSEDGVPQQISYFWEDVRPITVGFLFDDSARMRINDKIEVLKEAAQSFLKEKAPNDEYFLVRMGDFADVLVSFTKDASHLPATYSAIGETALYDAVYVGLSVIKEAANPRKVLVAVTSGGDRCVFNELLVVAMTCSDETKKTTEPMLKEFARKQPVQIYSLFIADTIGETRAQAFQREQALASDPAGLAASNARTALETAAAAEMIHRDAIVLEDLARMTGGRAYLVPNAARAVEAVTAEIARGLKTQYIIGYKSTRDARDGKRRSVNVKVSSPENSPKLNVWTKSGYYAPKG